MSKNGVAFNIQNLISSQEKYIEQVDFEINDKKYNLPLFKFIKYSQISEKNDNIKNIISDISNKLNKGIKYFQISDESLSLFFDILNEKEVNITSDEYWDLLHLSKIFHIQIFNEYLIEYSKTHSKDIGFIINLLYENENRRNRRNRQNSNCQNEEEHGFQESEYFEENEIKINNEIISIIEEEMKKNVCDCIKHPKFGKLSISTIYRILADCKIEGKMHDELYEFIRKSKETRFTLLQMIRISELSKNGIDELYQDYLNNDDSMNKKYEAYLSFDFKYLNQVKENEQTQNLRIQQLEKRLSELETQNKGMN